MHGIFYQLRHYPVFFCLTKNVMKTKIEAFKRRSMSVFNNKILFEKYKRELENNLNIFQNNNTDQNFNLFCNCLHFVVDKYQPLVEIKEKKKRNQWVTNRLKNLFSRREAMQEQNGREQKITLMNIIIFN